MSRSPLKTKKETVIPFYRPIRLEEMECVPREWAEYVHYTDQLLSFAESMTTLYFSTIREFYGIPRH